MQDARALVRIGDLESALTVLGEVFARQPRSISVGAFLQDVQIALLPAIAAAGQVTPEVRDRARRWRERAQERRTPTNLVLAARIEEDALAAKLLLEEALEIDDRCAWAHYGLAHHHAKADEWALAEEFLSLALEVDPGHLPARRLEAARLVRAGAPEVALAALDAWLEHAEDDPRVPSEQLWSAWFDRAHLLVDLDEPTEALASFERIVDEDWELGSRQALLAVIEFGRKRPSQALRAAQQSEELLPDSIVPLVQQALLHDARGGDPIASKRAWERVRAAVAETDEAALSSMIWSLRALVEIERLEARLPTVPLGVGNLDALEGGS